MLRASLHHCRWMPVTSLDRDFPDTFVEGAKGGVTCNQRAVMVVGKCVQNVYLDHSTYAPPPSRFEPGTPPIAEAIGMGAAADYISHLGLENIHSYEQEMGGYLYDKACHYRVPWLP